MHQLIEKIFKKRQISSIDELDEDEKKVFDGWNSILSKERLDTNDIKEFCKVQISVIENKWADLGVENAKKAELIPYHTVYRILLNIIDAPMESKEALERQLTEILIK